ncbi:MAG: type II toxin-antitoxin system prevent-host-death family antitoxin [Acidimicrobiaceae bacterium]|nr:type II toxin-antitoxin system prevent-host-death family antitoxin [Acidimicrobiaceae bacterium]
MHEAKSQLSRLGRLAWEGEEIVIARNGKPYLRLTPYERSPRTPGLWKGKVWIAPDFDDTSQDVIDSFCTSDNDEELFG